MKVKQDENYYFFICPGCDQEHLIPKAPSANGLKWTFNGDFNKPTFSPSVRLSWNRKDQPPDECHFNIVNGQIVYCGDCTHHGLSNQTLDLPDIS